ncbi:MAG: putative sugar nucleotidyl transferase [Candidatus Margulisiibacteriota bacterium]
MKICIFEDEGYKNLLPLVWLRPVWDLKCGVLTLKQKIRKYYKIDAELGRDYLGYPERSEGPCLYLNGRIIADARLKKAIPLKGPEEAFYCDGQLVAVRTQSPMSDVLSPKSSIPKKDIKARIINYPWDLVKHMPQELTKEIKPLVMGKIHKRAVLYNVKAIQVEKGAVVEANAVLDARQGPIYIGEGSLVHPGALLRGPLYIGPHCKVAGEIVFSIFMGYDNKGHYGFMGHAYVCEWVNMGAGTTNSNLKNNYGPVQIELNGEKHDTGETFMGCFIGDHTKMSIGTLINTGTVIGVFANIFGRKLAAKSIPSFSWGFTQKYELDKAIETAKVVMARRAVRLSAEQIELITRVYEKAGAP